MASGASLLRSAGCQELDVDILPVDLRPQRLPGRGSQIQYLQDHGHPVQLQVKFSRIMGSQIRIPQKSDGALQRRRKDSDLLFDHLVVHISIDHRFIPPCD